MALTTGFKVVIVVAAAAALVGGYVYWKGHHVPAAPPVDIAPATQEQTAPPVQPEQPQTETPTQPPVQVQAPVAEPAQTSSSSDDASSNRGMKFLLNQGQGK